MNLKRILEVLLHLSLLLGATLFLNYTEIISPFMIGDTSYTSSYEPLTLHDLPTITICWDCGYQGSRTYNEDFSIDLKIISIHRQTVTTVTLTENQEVQALTGLKIGLSELHQLRKQGMPCYTKPEWKSRQCYKITWINWKGYEQSKFKNFKIQMALKFDNSAQGTLWTPKTPDRVEVILSSEDNSYGMAGGKWFDGYVDCHSSIISKGMVYKIIGVDEFRNLETECSVDSYYRCLTKRFEEFDFKKVSNITVVDMFERHQCQFKNTCLPFSLPTMNKSLQICQRIYEGLCYEEIFEHLKSDQENHCKKSCNILEFKARYEADGIYMKFRDRDFLDELLNFRYKMWKKWRNESWAWNGNFTPENAIFMEFWRKFPN